jgi:hypothetical protein
MYSVAVGFFSGLAYVFRDSGIILLCTLLFVQIVRLVLVFRKRTLKLALPSVAANLLPYAVFLLVSFTFNGLLFPLTGRNDMFYLQQIRPVTVFLNIMYYFDCLSYFFYPRFIWFAVFTAIAWAMLRCLRRDLPFVIYFLGVMAMYILWPGGGQGIRYIVSTLPVLVFFGGRAVELLYGSKDSGGTVRAPAPLFVFNGQSYMLLAVLFCLSSLSVSLVADVCNIMSGRRLAYGGFTREAVEMYKYVDENISDDKQIYFFKPRLLHMTTGNAAVYTLPGQPVETGFDYYLHTFDHGYGQLLTDEQARADSFNFASGEFTCIHENAKMKLFRRTKK